MQCRKPKWKKTLSLVILIATLAAMVFEDQIGIKLCVSGCVGAILLILTGVISEREALKSIDLKTIFLFGGTLSLAAALQDTGAGEMIAGKVIGESMDGEKQQKLVDNFLAELGEQV